jgi:DNA-binding NarL/FixJ family response regulator
LSLRDKAVSADALASIDVGLALIWRELVGGSCRVNDSFFTEERCYLVLTPTLGAERAPIEGRRRDILESVLCGLGQKNIAMDLKLAPSTIALNARLGLVSMGIYCKPSRVHPLLMLAAKCSNPRTTQLAARLSFIQHDSEQLRVIAMPRPDRRLTTALPPAELAVVRMLIEGRCYAEIATGRGTSVRTIANQITAVFRRMRVSGRGELLHRLFLAEGSGRSPMPEPPTETLAPPASSRPAAPAAARHSA